jgi:phage-related protein
MRLGRYVSYTLTLTTDFPVWIKETKHVFRKTSASAGGKNLDYPFDFPFDFKSTIGSSQFNNASIAASNFRMIIYGACTDPEIKIGGHVYKVSGKVEANEYLTIDSVTREIYLTKNDGTRVNRFDNRYRRSYIFEPIPAGIAYVSWEGDFGLDLILFDERSEPKWI